MECDETTLASGLRLNRQGAPGTWGRIFVRTGRLRFRAATDPPIEVELEPGTAQAIPPGVEHDIVPTGPVRFTLEFLADKSNRSDMHAAGGDDE